jgi:hypothetical protein
MFSAVIYTTGRTGSQLIGHNLSSYFQSSYYDGRSFNADHGVVHCHNPLWIPPNDNFICIISKRKNLFNAILSSLFGNISKEYVAYTNKNFEPLTISEFDFIRCYWFMKTFYKAIDTSYYKQIVEIYYEDIIDNPKHLFSCFNIDRNTEYNLSKKSPYCYSELILNFNELQSLFNDLEKLPVTTQLIDSLKKTIETDLNK